MQLQNKNLYHEWTYHGDIAWNFPTLIIYIYILKTKHSSEVYPQVAPWLVRWVQPLKTYGLSLFLSIHLRSKTKFLNDPRYFWIIKFSQSSEPQFPNNENVSLDVHKTSNWLICYKTNQIKFIFFTTWRLLVIHTTVI